MLLLIPSRHTPLSTLVYFLDPLSKSEFLSFSQMNREYENKNQSGQRKQYPPEDLSLKGYYAIGALSVIIGIVIVGILNLTTPLQIITDRMAHVSRFSGPFFLLQFVPPLLFLLLVYVSFRIVLSIILRPIARYLNIITTGRSLPEGLEERAGRRLLNMGG
jgi:hypothetical protein